MNNRNLDLIVTLIEAQMERLGLDHDSHGDAFPPVEIVAELPAGFVAIHEDAFYYAGLATDLLNALTAIPYDGEDPDDTDHQGEIALHQALEADPLIYEPRDRSEFLDLGPEVWRDYHEFTGLEISGFGLLAFLTNGGVRYGFAPGDSDDSVFNSTHDFSGLFATADMALDAAADHAAREAHKATAEERANA